MNATPDTRIAFDEFYARYAPLCYGLALDKLQDKTGAEEILRSVFLSLKSAQLARTSPESVEKDICRMVHQELRLYKRRRVLKDLFTCSTTAKAMVSRVK